MIKLEQLLSEWSEDKIIHEESAHNDLIRIPILHGKYVEYLSKHKIATHKAKFDYIKMKKLRKEYFLGNLDKETLDEYGWEQFDYKIGTKSDIDLYLDSDDYLIKLLEKRVYHEECVSICEMIIKELHSRTFQIKEYLAHTRFLAGAY